MKNLFFSPAKKLQIFFSLLHQVWHENCNVFHVLIFFNIEDFKQEKLN